MAFDFKKEYKEFYMPKNTPEIVTVPRANYIAVRGQGDPNVEGGAYQAAIGVLYAVAYTLKMSYKSRVPLDLRDPPAGLCDRGGFPLGRGDGDEEEKARLLSGGVSDG